MLAGIVVAIGCYYADIFAQALVAYDKLNELIPLMIALVSIIALLMSFYTASSALYGFKDYDSLSAMPIKTGTIVVAKLAFMYLSDLIITALVAIPSVFVFAKYSEALSIELIVIVIIIIFTAPFLPRAISIIISALFYQ